MSQYCFLLGFSHKILSRSSHWIVGKRIYIYSRVRRNVKRHILPNRVFWRLDLATGLSREFKPCANGLVSLELFSYSEQLARCFSFWHAWHVCSNLVACSRESLLLCTHLSNSSHSLTHTLPLHDSHLNTGFLIAKIQANLAWNKANKMVN